jgi:leader peptidase (prepilin peptidase) / N-methyltransferase
MWLLAVVCAVIGLAIGSFLNVVIWRVPRDESVVTPRSHCPSCGHPVRPYDDIPVLSWLVLRGRCRDCGEPISVRYPLVELGTAVLFGITAGHFGAASELPAYLYLVAIGVALALIDLDVHRLPNKIVLPSYVVVPVLLLIASLGNDDWDALLRAGIGGALLYAVYFLLRIAYPSGMGFGDVKLAGLLGMYLGWLGWGQLAVGAFLGFLLGGVVGGALMAVSRATRKSKIPFGPFMITGAYVAVLVGGQISDLYLDVFVS